MRYRVFVPYSVLGTGLWVSCAIVLGYLFSRSIDTVLTYAGKGAFVLGAFIVVIVGFVALRRHLRGRGEPARGGALDGVARGDRLDRRSSTRRFRPQLEFLWARVTPGGTFGLEFTSLMAALAVGGFVLIGYISIVSGDPGPTPGDEVAAEIVEALRTGWLVDVAKAVTVLGSSAVVFPLAGICAVALAMRRRWAEVAVLLVGMAIVFVGVHEIKAAVDRPRPAGSLVDVSGSSFPSGHAAYATFYVWLAVMVVVRLRPGISRGAAIVTAGIALTALVGLSRVYLGVHYLSDVNAGWALGAAAFSLCAATALTISTLRQNGPVLPLALQKIENEYLLFGAAGVVCLAAFIGLILVPAVSSYGRIWEKAAAGVLSVIVLVALVLTGVVFGLAFVYYYDDDLRTSSAEPGAAARPARDNARHVGDRQRSEKGCKSSGMRGLSPRSLRRSRRAPACPPSRARRRGCSTPASP